MDEITSKRGSHNRFVIYILSFLFTLHYSLPSYINSSFLGNFLNEKMVSYIYAIGAVLAIVLFAFMPRILTRFGNYRVMFALLAIEVFSLVGLATVGSVDFVIPIFIASFICVAVINFNMDVFLENMSISNFIGKVRGLYLTSSNSAWVVAAVLMSFILTGNDYWKIFLAAAVLVVPIIFLLNANLKDFKDPVYMGPPLKTTLKQIWGNKNIKSIFVIGFLLQFFYSWMVIYTPIYLHNNLGYDWHTIGLMFAIMLLPFVLTEIPLGRIADNRLGEKEIMSIGFIITALATALMSFIGNGSVILWTILLFTSRIGASMIEVMSETYFFKKVDGTRANLMSLYRTMRPWSYVLGPILAAILFSWNLFEFKYIFAVLGIIMFFGLRYSLSLEDTR